MKIAWTSHLKTKDEKKNFEQLIRNLDRRVIERLEQILLQELDKVSTKERSPDQYNSSSWPFYQAHLNGYHQGIQVVLELFTDNVKEKKIG